MTDELMNVSAESVIDRRRQMIIDDAVMIFARLAYLDHFAKIAVVNELTYYPFAMWTSGQIQLQCQMLRKRGLPESVVKDLISAMDAIPGVQMPENASNRYPSIDVTSLKQPDNLNRFLHAIEVLLDKIKANADTSAAGATGLAIPASEVPD